MPPDGAAAALVCSKDYLAAFANAIAREVGVSPSSCFNIVKTLTLEGLLAFDERDKSYSPGPGLAMLSTAISNDQQLFQRIEPELATLAKRFSCTASFWRLTQQRLVLVSSVRGAAALNVHLDPGAAAASSDRGDGALHRREICSGTGRGSRARFGS